LSKTPHRVARSSRRAKRLPRRAGRRRGVRVRIASSVPAAVANCSERERPDTAQAAGPRRALPAQGLLQRLRALNGT